MAELKVSDLGEKKLISQIVRPLFDCGAVPPIIGNDCAVLAAPPGVDILVSTDRVPADLIAFRLGLIDYYGLGRYLSFLNISDIAACGGQPIGLLLNMGLRSSMRVSDFEALCHGVRDGAREYGCRVVGGDISDSGELSLSATVVGYAPRGKALTRTGARPGDSVFVTRALGLTPAAFTYFLRLKACVSVDDSDVERLKRQFTDIPPLVEVGSWLRETGRCTSCMDNTDGVAQSLSELAAESGVAIILEANRLTMPDLVTIVADEAGIDPMVLALGPGADFSLVGTVSSAFKASPPTRVGIEFQIVGRVEEGSGLHIDDATDRYALRPVGWDYFGRDVAEQLEERR